MGNWRIETNEDDQTSINKGASLFIGATVVRSSRGPSEFMRFDVGESQKIVDVFGVPTSTYSSIQDAIDLNQTCSVYLASPSKTGKYGGVFVTKQGTIPFASGFDTQTIADYSSVAQEDNIGTGDGITSNFTHNLNGYQYYENLSIDIKVNDISITISASDEDPEVLTSSPDIGSGTYNRTTGLLDFTFDAPITSGESIDITYNLDLSDGLYFILYDSYFQEDNRRVQVTADSNITGAFYIAVDQWNTVSSSWVSLSNSPYHVSIVEDGKDDSNVLIDIEEVFEDSYFFTPVINNRVFTSFVDDTTTIELNGGDRGVTAESADFVAIYDDLKDKETYDVSLVIHGEADQTVASNFETLRNGECSRTRFAFPGIDTTAEAIIADPSTYKYNINNRGVYCYGATWGTHLNNYGGKNINCSNMGLIGGKIADIVQNGPGGSPSWIDENGLGGQLGSKIVSFNQFVTDTQNELLTDDRINTCIMHSTHGAMILSSRTTLSKETDMSYIEYSSLQDYILKQIENDVLPLQIKKTNDNYHRQVQKSLCEGVIETAENFIEDSLVKCDLDNNTASVRANKKCVVSIGVQYTSISNMVILNYVTSNIGVSIEDTL